MLSRSLVSLFVLALVACDDAPTPASSDAPTRSAGQAAIYGNDDRTDWYAETDEGLKQLGYRSIVAMIDRSEIDDDDPANVQIDGDVLGPSYSLCTDERFYDQMSAASCSGTLIDDDLVLTAGHCVGVDDCGSNRWVFRYLYESEGELSPLTAEDVYNCEETLVRRVSSTRDGEWDYAIIRLDRPATPRHEPAAFALPLAAVATGDPVRILGFGSGLPLKIDAGGVVTSARSNSLDYFEATTDSFGGNSGSGVFNTANQVIGILVRGQQDYSYRRGCGVATEYPEEGTSDGSEGISYAAQAVNALCETGWPSVRLCGTEVACGDGICSPREECDEDCAPVCGDGNCEPGEEESCEDDCGSDVPAGWSCDAEIWGAGDGCDCRCGAWDTDCDDPRQEVFNCEANEACVEPGVCRANVEPPPDVPEGWFCDAAFYNDGNGCDCACGAWDLDCDDPTAEVYNCTARDTCVEPGVCSRGGGGEDAGPIDVPDAGGDASGGGDDGLGNILNGDDGAGSPGCATAGAGNASSLGLALFGLAVLSRRRRAMR